MSIASASATAAAAGVIDDDVEQSESSGYVSIETMPQGQPQRIDLFLQHRRLVIVLH